MRQLFHVIFTHSVFTEGHQNALHSKIPSLDYGNLGHCEAKRVFTGKTTQHKKVHETWTVELCLVLGWVQHK